MSKHPPCPGSGMAPDIAHTCPVCRENFMRSDAPLRVFCKNVIPHHRPRCRYVFSSRRRCSNTAVDGSMCETHRTTCPGCGCIVPADEISTKPPQAETP